MLYNIFTGGFYQDEMGQVDCKRCSIGTFVSEQRRPGTKATDCVACPYGNCCVCFGRTAPFFNSNALKNNAEIFFFFSEKTIDSTFDSHNRQILVRQTKHIHRKWIIRKSTRLIICSEKNQEMSYSQDNSYLIHW